MDPSVGTAVRVLSRGPPPISSPSLSIPSFNPSPPATCPPHEEIVAVGFIGNTSSTDLSQLINRIIDSNTFGSGRLDRDLLEGNGSDWCRNRKVSYHYDAEKAMVFLQFSSSLAPLESLAMYDSSERVNASVLELENSELQDLKGMLFMFSVCHIIIFLHEGLRFDTQLLKKFRLLQTSKQALSQFIKFEENPKKPTSETSNAATHTNTSFPQLAQRGHHMSGTSSNQPASAGQSSPVILFVLQDDIFDGSTSVSTTDNTPLGKNDSGFRKRLIASLDTQLRFLMKKLHLSLRVTGKSNYPPLFSLDQSRAITLIDRPTNRRGEPLNYLTSLIDTSMTPKLAFDFLANENTSHFTNNEEIQVIRDFIFRQSEMLRGGGSGAAGNLSTSSMSGVGMAAAAIAAVTSSAVVKPAMGLELLSLDKWLSASTLILNPLTSLKINFPEDRSDSSNNIEAPLFCLVRGTSINKKFSISWCENELPVARDVYLQNLPPFYRTCTHKEHLTKALEAFRAAVKGPAVSEFMIKLEKECNSIWENGRQQCDVSSLTGKPCMLQRHDMDDLVIRRQHCSRYFFLHACACGRSRTLRDDPFDIETANVKFCVLPKCEGLLPTIEIPPADGVSPVMASAWRLMRVGGAGYYKPEKGLLQTGFCSREKYLFQWKIRNTSDNDTNDLSSIVGSSETVKERREMDHFNVNNKKQVATNLKFTFGKDLPNSTTKKPFAEVVAGTVMTDSEFPALQKMHSKPSISHKDTKQNKSSGPQNETKVLSGDIQIANNVVPVINKDKGTKENKSMREFTVRVGFEHECPHGHRFLLSEKHLKGLDSPLLSDKSREKSLGNKKGFPTNVLQSSTTKANKMKEGTVKHSSQSVRASGMADENEKCKDGGRAFSLLNRKLPIFINCPHCGKSENQHSQQIKFAGTISQLQRIFIVTPSFPVLLATCPVVQFEDSCLPVSVSNREQQSRFGFGSRIILPPDSFLTLKLPFIYGVETDNGSLYPLNPFDQPESTAWLVEGTALQLVSIGNFPSVV